MILKFQKVGVIYIYIYIYINKSNNKIHKLVWDP